MNTTGFCALYRNVFKPRNSLSCSGSDYPIDYLLNNYGASVKNLYIPTTFSQYYCFLITYNKISIGALLFINNIWYYANMFLF